MTIRLKPEVEKKLQERLNSGAYGSAEELVNAVLEQYMSDDFEPGELDKLLAVGEAQANRGQFVDGEEVFRRLKARSDERRKGT
jgi:Arc/MetJ-type ribon-helix-helix transcriptional regulator